MQAQSLLTLSEIAEHYRCSTKTFSKYVREYKIPFRKLGKSKLFRLAEVDEILRTIQADEVVFALPLRRVYSGRVVYDKNNKYAKLLGL
jgi:excisionase family DNA binding protein